MPRAKYTSDPRRCPICGRKSLYARTALVRVGDDEAYVSVDHCNHCRADTFDGKPLRECRAEALVASASDEERQAQAHRSRADLMRTMAANLGVLAPDD